jgi:hypothetical protein
MAFVSMLLHRKKAKLNYLGVVIKMYIRIHGRWGRLSNPHGLLGLRGAGAMVG